MAKELSELYWVEDLLPEGSIRKRMFGGFSYYLDEKLLLVVFESTGSKVHRGTKYEFEIWNGCMFPAEKEFHPSILEQFPHLVNHPVLPKWLYLPMETEDFEAKVEGILKELRRRNPWFGSYPKGRSSAKTTGKSKRAPEPIDRIDTRRPRMFSDESPDEALAKAKKISDLKNLGAEMEKVFNQAGIKTAQQLEKLGWKKAMVQLCKANPKYNHSMVTYAVIGALQNKIWSGITEDEKREAREYMKELRDKEKPAKKVKAKAGKSSQKKARSQKKAKKSSRKK